MISGMKHAIAGTVRRAVPRGVAQGLRGSYRVAWAHAASARYGYPARYLKVIAVVGTTGKTTTAMYLDSILRASGFTTALMTSETTTIKDTTRPAADMLSARRVQGFLRRAKRADVDYVVVEASAAALGARFFHTVAVECVVMTNTEPGTDDAEAIAQLLAYVPRYVVLNADDAAYAQLKDYEAAEHKMSYGTEVAADSRIRQVKLYKRGSEAQLLIDHHTTLELGTQLPGRHNVYNMTAAAMAAYLMYIKLEAIQDGIAELAPLPGRFERLEADKPYDVIVDVASTPAALATVLDSARGMAKNRLIVVTSTTDNGVLAEVLAQADRVFLYSITDDLTMPPSIIAAGSEPKTEVIAGRTETLTKALGIARAGDVVVIIATDETYAADRHALLGDTVVPGPETKQD